MQKELLPRKNFIRYFPNSLFNFPFHLCEVCDKLFSAKDYKFFENGGTG